MVTIACKHCGKPFEAWPNRVRSGRSKFCSRACKDTYQQELTGDKSPRMGQPHTEEARAKMSAKAQERTNRRKFLGQKHPGWKGGYVTSHGYRYVILGALSEEDRALAETMVTGTKPYILEHRLVMARKLGRPLLRSEVVHHLNGQKTDNRPENLALMENDKHSREHRKIDIELLALREENRRLRSLLMTFLPPGSDISSLLASL